MESETYAKVRCNLLGKNNKTVCKGMMLKNDKCLFAVSLKVKIQYIYPVHSIVYVQLRSYYILFPMYFRMRLSFLFRSII